MPHGHRDRAGVREVADLRIGEEATVMVSVRSARVRPTRRRNLRLVEAAVADASGPMKAVWFNQAYLAERLRPGTRLLLNGKLDRAGFRVATHEIVAGGGGPPGGPVATGLHTTGIVPVHGATARALGERACASGPGRRSGAPATRSSRCPPSCAPAGACGAEADALRCAHFPDSPEQAATARDRLAFEELCLHQAALAVRRGRAARIGARDRASSPPGELVGRWLASLPFELTGGQRRAVRGDRRRPRSAASRCSGC